MMLMVTMMPTKLMRKALLGDSDEQKKVTCNWVQSITGSYYIVCDAKYNLLYCRECSSYCNAMHSRLCALQ